MNRAELEQMKKEEYYNSPQFSLLRFFQNGASKINMDAQDLKEILNLVAHEFELNCMAGTASDKYYLVATQIKLIHAECQNLVKMVSDLSRVVEPRKWSDWENGPIKKEVVQLTEGRVSKGGQNPPNYSLKRPAPPKGSGGSGD
ncbi:MAG: hypothetical protein DWQ19_09875 [Crenarchaeota archaeon]|nr:MAG: hypothetical protein DWQ19_09875 [Thermoproteota archaeon]